MTETNWFHDLTTDEARGERTTLAQRIIAVLGTICGLVLLCIAVTWPTNANAQDIPLHVLDKNGVVIELMGTECVDPISLALVKEGYRPRLKAIKSVWTERDGSRKAYAGCWMELTKEEAGGEESFLLVFEDQQHGVVSKTEFKKVQGQSGV